MEKIIYKEESFKIIGLCMDVYNYLGPGFLEIVYKDALEYEFSKASIPFMREKKYEIRYKEIQLNYSFVADFVVYDKIILEVKSVSALDKSFTARCINYLRASSNKLSLLVNFGESKLNYKRIVL